MKPLPPLIELRKRLRLDVETGVLRWSDGRVAGCPRGRGYLGVRFDGAQLYAHRIVFALVAGYDPFPFQVDHIDGNKANNAPINLRLVNNAENNRNRSSLNRNNTSGAAGVYWSKAAGRWAAEIKVRGVKTHLGLFNTFWEALAKRRLAEIEYGFNPVGGL